MPQPYRCINNYAYVKLSSIKKIVENIHIKR